MSRLFHSLLISVVSTSLICSPLFLLNSNADNKRPSWQGRNLSPQEFADHEPGVLLVKFIPEAPKQSQDFIINTFSKSHRRLRGQSDIIKLTLKGNLDFTKTLDALRKSGGVIESVEPNYFVKRAGVGRTVRLPQTRATRHAKGKRTLPNPSTIIALVDTGIDIRHRDLKDGLWLNGSEKSGPSGSDDDRNGFTDDTRGWNFINDSGDIDDDNGHGTQVAGIIAQSGAPVSILPLKALDHTGTGTIADVVEAMDYAVARHAAVINCSFGAPVYSRALLDAIKRAEIAGVVVVAAAGNNGKDLSKSSFYPASYRLPNLISVAATDENNLLTSFSNYSADIAAPGANIRTTHRDNSYVQLSGTSAAAGFVSAAAGLLKSKRGWVSAQTIRDAILKSANQSFDLKDKVSSKGALNPSSALSLFTRDSKDSARAPAPNKGMTPVIKAALQSGNGNLDTMRSSQPQAPNAYQQTGTLPPASYDDPKPANTANYDSYLTHLVGDGNATGVAGSKPQQSADPTAGTASVGGWNCNLDSQNYNFTLPVVGLPGRAGLGVSLGLSYNSKLWIRDPTTNTVVFNPDRGFPAPGWRIGFGLIQVKINTFGAYLNGTTGKNSVIYIAPDGTRHDLAFNPTTNRYESYDSSYIAFDANQQIMYFPDGTKAQYGANSYDPNVRDFQQHPLEIKDRNGNFITITYKTLSTQKVVIDYVTDTAGRRIDFNYQNNKLVSVSQNRNGSVYKYVNIDYQPVTIQTNFSGGATVDPSNINGAQVYFPSRISYPTGINFRFVYTSYGQINAIEKWVPTITGQGNERKVASTSFNLATYDPNYPQSAAPSFSTRTEWAENWQGGASQIYQYGYWGAYGHEVYDPTSRLFRVWRNGMNTSLTITGSGAGNWTKKDEATYISDSGVSYVSNPRVSQAKTTAFDGSGYTVRTTNYTYLQRDGMWLVENRDDLNTSGGLYRRTTTAYTSYPSQNILGLPQQVSVYNGSNTLLSRVTNNYDEMGTFTDSNGQTASYFIDATGDGVIQHNVSYGASFTQRGNLTSVTQHSVVEGYITDTHCGRRISYDTNGNRRAETDGAGNRQQFSYADNYSNKPAGVGQTHVQIYTAADPTGFRAGSQQNYYTGQTIKAFNLTPGSSTETQVVTTSYDFADRPLVTTRPDGGWGRTGYWDNWLASVASQRVETGQVRFAFEHYDGTGRYRDREASDHPDGVTGKYSGRITVFDKVGQIEDTSNVIAITGTWAPTAEDASTGFLFTHLTRDELSRLKIVTYPDNNTKQFDYTGCGCAGTAETRVTDELGHYTITKTDFLGRLVEAIEPIGLDNSTYSKASYHYDELDRLLTINHSSAYNSITGHTPTQSRHFGYDGYGRLQSENTPEGGIVNYTYTANDLVQTVADQRNITVTNSYNTRNLLTGVSYSDGTPATSFGYDAFGARSSMTDGEGATSYNYTSFRQLQSESRTFTGLPGNTYTLNYIYNLADQLKSVNYLVTTGATPGAPSVRSHFGSVGAAPYTVSGVVTDGQNQPVSGVTVSLSGDQTGQTTTASNGSYSFSGLAVGNYTLTPSKSGYVFNPSSINYPDLQKNKTDANFTALPAQQTLFNKNVNYVYNSVGALAGVGTNLIGSDPNATTNVLNTLTFRGSGAIKSINYGNGRRLQMGYNANRQQPTSMKVDMTSNPNDTIIDYAYEFYDANGKNNNRIRKITDNVDSAYTIDYLYDEQDRLTNASAPAYSRSYFYDAWGNIKNFNGVTLNYATNSSGAPATNRLASDGTGFNYSFDAAGNMTSAPGYSYAYDGANRLNQVNGGTATYGYDGIGMKVRETSNGSPIYYVRSSLLNSVVIEVNAAGVYRAYVYKGKKLIAQQSYDGQFYWMHTDHLGSGHKMTDSTGVVKYRSELDSYGQAVLSWAASGDTNINSKRFATYERDTASGLDYANARMYNNGRGRFMQADPIGLQASDMKSPQSLNLYSYTQNDPVNFVDPSGLDSLNLPLWSRWECDLYRRVPWWDSGRWFWHGCDRFRAGEGERRDDPDGARGGDGGGGQGCDVVIPDSNSDEFAVASAILGEASLRMSMGGRQFDTDQSGPLNAVGAPRGDVITEDTLRKEMELFLLVFKNRLKDGRFGTTLREVASSSEIVGYGNGKKILENPNFARLNRNGGNRCEQLRMALEVIQNGPRYGADGLLYWKAVVQGSPAFVRQFNQLYDRMRVAGTDFSTRN